MDFHLKENNDLTAVVTKKLFCIPYGIFKNDKKKIYFTEKPKFKFRINVGLYLLNKNILNLLKRKQHLDFNTLLEKSLKKNKKIGYYEIKDRDWIDVGQMDKYKNFINKKI